MPQILIAEDNADSCEALAELLKNEGHEICCASNGKEAFKKVFAHIPDLIVLDLAMPGADGALFLETIRSYLRFTTLPVVVWTGYPEGPLAEIARTLDVEAVIAKGKASYDDLLAAIRKALHRKTRPKSN